jgi:hypothetical protein
MLQQVSPDKVLLGDGILILHQVLEAMLHPGRDSAYERTFVPILIPAFEAPTLKLENLTEAGSSESSPRGELFETRPRDGLGDDVPFLLSTRPRSYRRRG